MPDSPSQVVEKLLIDADIPVISVEERQFPGELFVVAAVAAEDVQRASEEVYRVSLPKTDAGESVLVSVRAAALDEKETAKAAVAGVSDQRVDGMIQLITSRSRSSLSAPSLQYIQDGQANLSQLVSARHCFVFGRRGAGKTALLVEGRRHVESAGAVSVWLNMQLYRGYSVGAMVVAFARVVVEELTNELSKVAGSPSDGAGGVLARVGATAERLREVEEPSAHEVPAWLPVEVNAALRQFTSATARPVFVFVDDFYLYPRHQQAYVLEGMHACTRDTETWLKLASIKHLTRQWDATTQSGLESPHDVDAIELDLTLQDPQASTSFLVRVLESYAARAGIASLQSVFHRRALDRLVLASGAVPRDYLVLANQAIGEARKRPNARVVGVEDVNRAAGHASAAKRRELEEDLASESADAGLTLHALTALRGFCLDRSDPWTYFRVSFRSKETRQEEYGLLTRLLEVRMIHMLDASISDPNRAGSRFEVYMLDLSEYTGQRLRRGVHALSFEGGRLVAQKTGEPKSKREGNRARDVTGIFRRAPELDLAVLAP